jgi:hypothetical protein
LLMAAWKCQIGDLTRSESIELQLRRLDKNAVRSTDQQRLLDVVVGIWVMRPKPSR